MIFTKWIPGKFPASLESLAEMFSRTSKIFRKKCYLNECTVLYFFSNEVITGTL